MNRALVVAPLLVLLAVPAAIDLNRERARVISGADRYVGERPITVTASSSPRSAGGRHDFFSEGDYWWPDPQNPAGPYIQRDGMSNPDNFNDHRRYLMRLSVQVPALAAAWKLTGDRRYSDHALKHLRAWFVDPATRMNPSLQYAQAIQGRATGRGTGIIDTIHLVEVARAAEVMDKAPGWPAEDKAALRRWFTEYLNKKSWPKPPDVMYDAEWPMRHPSLLFAGLALNKPDYVSLWSTLPADSDVDEVIRNFFVRQPVLWIDTQGAKPVAAAPVKSVLLQTIDDPALTTNRVTVESPNSQIKFYLNLRSEDRAAYRVTLKGHPVIESSRLGILVDGVNLGDGATITGAERTRQDDRYRTRGVHSVAVNRYNAATIALTHQPTGTRYSIEVRAFDDGVAFRYIVAASGNGARVPDEATVFNFPPRSVVWYHDLDGHYEGVHEKKDVEDVQEGDWAAPPVTAQLPDATGYASITEAALKDYAGMVLQTDRRGGFAGRLAHSAPASYPYRLRYPALEVRRLEIPASTTGTITTPWRVILAGPDLNTLVNSDIISNLSAPPDPALFPQGIETPWVKPGRAVWRYLDGGENTFDGIKEFSDLAAKLGFEYQVVEGLWRRWTDDQLRELISFSNARKVGILLWVHSRDIQARDVRRALFQRLHVLGVAGVKIDFFDHEAKDVIDLYQAILRDSAEFQLLVDFHGANKPAGESRTWPNELTREGVYGLEHRALTWARHDTTIPFTRYLAGHGDFTPVVFGDRRRETSWAHQIATAAIFTSPLLVYGANPRSLLENPAAELIKALPSTWDETIVLPGSAIGELAAFARRKGNDWFIAVLNGPEARTLHVNLTFLGPRSYNATLVRDDLDNAASERIDQSTLTRQGSLSITLRAGGGFIGRLVPRM